MVAAHCNPVPCVIAGKCGPVSVVCDGEVICGDAVYIRPGVEHSVIDGLGGINAIYMDGLLALEDFRCALRLEGRMLISAMDAMTKGADAQTDLRQRLAARNAPEIHKLKPVIAHIVAEPMMRMTQDMLANQLGAERTTALRMFKESTGMTFRRFKQWLGLQHAARQIIAGELVRTAAMDAGFSDTAHLTRTFRMSFGLTPSQAIDAFARSGQA